MTELIKAQAFEMFIMFYAGMAVMLIFEMKNYLTCHLETKKRIIVASEIMAWILAASLTCSFMYRCSCGKPSLAGGIALAAGALLWKNCLYGIIDKGTKNAKEKRENP